MRVKTPIHGENFSIRIIVRMRDFLNKVRLIVIRNSYKKRN
jgi:hypothetical protein